MEAIPRDLRNLRACLLCSLVKSFDQFELDGCDNCDRVLQMRRDRDKVLFFLPSSCPTLLLPQVYECTSSNFDGMVALMQPQDSWVAKWLKIKKVCRW